MSHRNSGVFRLKVIGLRLVFSVKVKVKVKVNVKVIV